MTFINTIPEADARDAVRAMYDKARDEHGFLPNLVKAFSQRPQVMAAWEALLASIRGNMDLRRYELVTIAAARTLRSSYCMLAHGSVLLKDQLDTDQLRSIAEDPASSGLDDTEKAIMRFAAKVVRDAQSVAREDVEELKAHGLSDAEVFDVVAAAAVRCFFSKTLDALGTSPDARFRAMPGSLRDVLVTGRPIADD